MKALIKPQYVDQIPKAVKGTVKELMVKKGDVDASERILSSLGQLLIVCPKLKQLSVTLMHL